MNALLEHVQNIYVPTLQVIWPSLLAAVALALAGGVVGVFVILRRETLVALAMPQIVVLGTAIGLRQGWPTLPPAIVAVALAMGMMAWSKRRDPGGFLLPALYIAGICLSILAIANAGAHLVEVQNRFVGIDVAVGKNEAVIATGVLLAAGAVCAVLWRRRLLLAQAPAAAELANLHPTRWNGLFLCLLAAVLVMATDVVGTTMTLALLFLPAATALPWVKRIPHAMAAAVLVAIASVMAGFVLSMEMDWPLSHSIGGAGFVVFITSYFLAQFFA